jgi:hypothetical protein
MKDLKEDLFELFIEWFLFAMEAAAELLLATTIFTSALLSIFPTLWNGFRRVGREMKLPH